MLFVINNSLVSSLAEDETLQALEMMAIAYQEGNHLFFASRETLTAFSECSDLSKLTCQIYKDIRQDSTQLKTIFNLVTQYIEVSTGNKHIQETIKENKTVIEIPPHLISYRLLQETNLLCENVQDGLLIAEIAKKFYAVQKGLTTISDLIKYDEHNGGGATTHQIYEKFIKQRKLCLCITDSDKKAPNHTPQDTTTNKVATIDNSHNPLLANHHVLNVHELENLFPISLYILVLQHHRDCQNDCQTCLSFLRNVQTHPTLSAMIKKDVQRYFDLKKGFTKSQNLINEPDFNGFWDPILQATSYTRSLNGLGNSVIKQIQKSIFPDPANPPPQQPITEQQLFVAIKDAQLEDIWLELGQLIFDWCCASNRRLAAV